MRLLHYRIIATIAMSIVGALSMYAQQRVGINTTNPLRQLEINGTGSQYLRIHSSSPSGNLVSLELVRGWLGFTNTDWRIANANGNLFFSTTSDNFTTTWETPLRITSDHNVGIGITAPVAKLHIDGGEDVSLTTDGFLLLGNKGLLNMALDHNKIQVRNNGVASSLYVQPEGGNTWFGDGDVKIGGVNGKMAVGVAPLNARLNVQGGSYQIRLRNTLNGTNDWYIGASDLTWQTGDDYLLFSPTTSHLAATLRLNKFSDNDGFEAPVEIVSPSSNRLLLDGNEIDTYSTPLYLNSNSEENIYLNPNGGLVGVGTSSPDAGLHIKSTEFGLGMSENFSTWWIIPSVTKNLNFYRNTGLLAYVSYAGGGEWVALSDRNAKTDISRYENTLEKILQLELVRYGYVYDTTGYRDFGVIAQQVEPLFPEVVSKSDEQYAVSYDQLTVVAIRGLQEQHEQLKELLSMADAHLKQLNDQ